MHIPSKKITKNNSQGIIFVNNFVSEGIVKKNGWCRQMLLAKKRAYFHQSMVIEMRRVLLLRYLSKSSPSGVHVPREAQSKVKANVDSQALRVGSWQNGFFADF